MGFILGLSLSTESPIWTFASKLHVTLKTAFLLALATAKRCSKIHALAMDSNHLRFNQSGTGQWVCTFRHRELVTRQLTLSPDTSHWSSNINYWAPVTDHQFGTRHQSSGTRYQMVNYTKSLNLEQSATNEPPWIIGDLYCLWSQISILCLT